MTLIEYATEREYVVVFWVSNGTPTGNYATIGYPDMDIADPWFDLEGTVSEGDIWNWDGEDRPNDLWMNTILKLQAYEDAPRWQTLVKEYEEA